MKYIATGRVANSSTSYYKTQRCRKSRTSTAADMEQMSEQVAAGVSVEEAESTTPTEQQDKPSPTSGKYLIVV